MKIDFANGKIMLVISLIVALIIMVIFSLITKNFLKSRWSIFIPSLICIIVMIPSFYISIILNGIGRYTGQDVLGVFMYAFWTFIFSFVIGLLILIVKWFF